MAERASNAALAERTYDFDTRDFNLVCKLIHQRAGIAMTPAKRDMVYGRLSRRIRHLGMDSFREYLDALQADPNGPEWEAFTNALTTNLTSFFREQHHFPTLAALMREQPHGERIELWCAAASTGEEPYSMAITACETFGSMTPPVRILATDIATNVLQTAARGVYRLDRMNGISDALRKKYFLKGTGPNAGMAKVKPELRSLITFAQLNLLDPHYDLPGDYAAVFCRNVMIYFDKPTQYGVLSRIMPLIKPGGLLFAGHSESFTHAADLVDSCGRTVYRAAGASR